MLSDKRKRQFLVDVIGEEKTAGLEAFLSSQRERLEDLGIDWKAATSFQALAADQQFSRLCDQLLAIIENVLGSDTSPEEKRQAILTATEDFSRLLDEALAGEGGKQRRLKAQRSRSPVDRYLQQLSPATLGAKEQSLVRQLESSSPCGKYVADVVALVAAQGG